MWKCLSNAVYCYVFKCIWRNMQRQGSCPGGALSLISLPKHDLLVHRGIPGLVHGATVLFSTAAPGFSSCEDGTGKAAYPHPLFIHSCCVIHARNCTPAFITSKIVHGCSLPNTSCIPLPTFPMHLSLQQYFVVVV